MPRIRVIVYQTNPQDLARCEQVLAETVNRSDLALVGYLQDIASTLEAGKPQLLITSKIPTVEPMMTARVLAGFKVGNSQLQIASFSRIRLGEDKDYYAVIPKGYNEDFGGPELVRVVREFLAANPE